MTGLWAEFIAEIANSSTSPRGMNWDWLMGDMLMGDTSPAGGDKDHFNTSLSITMEHTMTDSSVS